MNTSACSVFGEGGISYGPFLKISDPAVVEICGLAGFDHVVIDCEHGPLSIESVQNLIRAAELRNVRPFVRVPRNDASEILRALDVGAAGVHVPHVSTSADAQRAVEACRFHPQGDRGICRFVRAAGYTSIPAHQHFADSNERVVPVLHIEGAEGVANLPDILEVPGVGVIFLGPYDLSQACGVPGEVHHAKVLEMMRGAVEQAGQAGVVVGTFIDNPEEAKRWTDMGLQYICCSVDVGILYSACRGIVGALKRV